MHVTSERMSQPSSGSNSRREGGGLNRHNEKNDMRQRRNDPNQVSRRDYNNPIGGRQVENDDTDTATSHNKGHEYHRRKEIRHRVERKHQRIAPIWWTKFMHSETKNRKFSPSYADISCWEFHRPGSGTWRICWYDYVSLLRLRRHASCECSNGADNRQHFDSCKWSKSRNPALHFPIFWLQPDGQRLGFLSY